MCQEPLLTLKGNFTPNLSLSERNGACKQSTVHEGVGYLCIQWDKQFYWKENFCEHQREAHKEVKYPCGQCLEQFSLSGNLGKHQRQVY